MSFTDDTTGSDAVTTDQGRLQLKHLLSKVDVVIEGSRPRALAQMGIDAASLTAEGPRIWVSITAHGRMGGDGQRVGFGDDAAAAGGLLGWVDDHPVFIADAIADPLTGLIVAATTAQLAAGGGRWMVDVALARVAASMAHRPADGVVRSASPPARPRVRSDPGAPLLRGRDTSRILEEFGISRDRSSMGIRTPDSLRRVPTAG